MKNSLKDMFKKILICLMVCFSLTTNEVKAISLFKQASRAMWVTLYDEQNYEINYMFFEEEKNILEKIVRSIGDGRLLDYSNPSVFDVNDYATETPSRGIGDDISIMLFPSISIDNTDIEVDSQDYKQGEKVLGSLTQNLNSAISYVRSYGTGNATNLKINEIVAKIAGVAESGSSNDFFGIQVVKGSQGNTKRTAKAYEAIEKEINQIKDTWGAGISFDDYIIFYTEEGGAVPFMWRCPTGYGDGQFLSQSHSTNGDWQALETKLTWKDLACVAATAMKNGITSDVGGFETIAANTKNDLEKALASFADNIKKTLSVDLLGFYSLESMILNRGTRGVSYYLGMMPRSWFNQANNIFWIMEIIAVFILLASVLYSVYKQNYAIISPKEKINLQDRIQALLISIILLMLYIPVFYLMGKFNQSIIELLDSLVVGTEFSSATNVTWILSLIMAVVDLFIMIKINVDYLVRALTITVLHVMAPVMIASMSLFPEKGLFNSWWKEMVSAIFMQSFDALILVLFMLVAKTGGTVRWWEIALMTFMFIPMNKWFKQTFGGSNGIGTISDGTQKAAGDAISKTVGTAKGALNLGGNIHSNLKEAVDTKTEAIQGKPQSKNNGQGYTMEIHRGKTISPASGSEKADGTLNSNSQRKEDNQETWTADVKPVGNKTEKKPKEALTGSEKAGVVGRTILTSTGLGGLAGGLDTRQKQKWEEAGGNSISSRNHNSQPKNNEEKKQERKSPTSGLEGRKYSNDDVQKEYEEEQNNAYDNAMKRFQDLSEDELEIEWNNNFVPEITQDTDLSAEELNAYVENNNTNQRVGNNIEITPEKQKENSQNKKQRMAETYAHSTANKKIDKKHPTEQYKKREYNPIEKEH